MPRFGNALARVARRLAVSTLACLVALPALGDPSVSQAAARPAHHPLRQHGRGEGHVTPVVSASGVRLTLAATPGWSVVGPVTVSLGSVSAGRTATATFRVTAPAPGTPRPVVLTATATAEHGGRRTTANGAGSITIPIPPPTGTVKGSDLPFSGGNGWGPVERDMSNGGSGTGDGRPITMNGVVYPKGLGVHAPSNTRVFLGANCTRFTAVVGVDDEVADPTGGRWLELITDDGGDGNASDHINWADATIVRQ